ncbi:MAG: hypothetical protein ABEI31_04900 [Halodesulfurarchaeum sp.]
MTTRYPAISVLAPFTSTGAVGPIARPLDGFLPGARDWAATLRPFCRVQVPFGA